VGSKQEQAQPTIQQTQMGEQLKAILDEKTGAKRKNKMTEKY
jgi:hypothetical protein